MAKIREISRSGLEFGTNMIFFMIHVILDLQSWFEKALRISDLYLIRRTIQVNSIEYWLIWKSVARLGDKGRYLPHVYLIPE